jgi:hypothetical protein
LLIGISEVAEYKLLRRFVNENGKIEYVRIQPDEIKIGEKVYVEGNDNKIKRLNENTYMFMRFDSIDTVKHTDGVKCDKTLADLHKEVHSKLDYDLEYAEDRSNLLKQLIKDDHWVYDYISTHRYIKKQIKSKKSLLAKDDPFDRTVDKLSSYVYHPKYENKEDEYRIKQLKLEAKKLKKKKYFYDKYDELMDAIDFLRNHHSYTYKNKLRHEREELKEDIVYAEELSNTLKTEESMYRQKILKRDLRRNMDNYDWGKMYSKVGNNYIPFYNKKIEPAIQFRKKSITQFKGEIQKLKEFLGLNIKGERNRELHKQRLIEQLDMMAKEKNLDLNGQQCYLKLIKTYNSLCGDYKAAEPILVDEIEFKRLDKSSTVYNFDLDTWYEDENGNIVEISKNTINFGLKETYRGLLLNYVDLKNKYYDKPNSDMWAILKDFEDILKKTELTFEEKLLISLLFEDLSQKQIREILKDGGIKFTKDKVSRMINEQIPRKLLDTYLLFIDDYIYSNWIKGKYKKCSKCGEIKLISNDRYFRKRHDSKDGFRNECRICESSAKKCEKL